MGATGAGDVAGKVGSGTGKPNRPTVEGPVAEALPACASSGAADATEPAGVAPASGA
jgi:hypothetical protein